MNITANKKRLISVIIPVYNTAKYLPRCLDSVLNNTYDQFEVICIDDGSTDESGTVLNSYAQNDHRIHIITQENKGAAAARNAGLDKASGDYISFIDSDDWVHLQYFEILLSTAERFHADITACDMANTLTENCTALQKTKLNITDLDRKDYLIFKGKRAVTGKKITGNGVPFKLYRADLLKNVRFQQKINIEDLPFCLEAVSTTEDICCVYIPFKIYYYDRHGNTLSTKLTLNDQYQMAVYYYDQGVDAAEKHQDYRAYAYLLHAMKRGILLRYTCMFHPEKKKICHNFTQICIKQFLKLRYPSLYEKVRYRLLAGSPLIYHIAHLLKRPSDLRYELRSLKKSLHQRH